MTRSPGVLPVSRVRFGELVGEWWRSGIPTRAQLAEVLRASWGDWQARADRSEVDRAALRGWLPRLQRLCDLAGLDCPEIEAGAALEGVNNA